MLPAMPEAKRAAAVTDMPATQRAGAGSGAATGTETRVGDVDWLQECPNETHPKM